MSVVTELHPRLNIGCGRFPLEGYTNVDDTCEEADIVEDVWRLSPPSPLTEVRMDHFLEHIPWPLTEVLLEKVRGWMRPMGLLVVEVPDMTAIFEQGTTGDWLRYVYGSQQHPGEFHVAGFTALTLKLAIEKAGFELVKVWPLISTFETRMGMPCLKATAVAP